MKYAEIRRIKDDIKSLGESYSERHGQHIRMKELERFLNVVMVTLMVISIIAIQVIMPPYGGIVSIIIFSTGIIILIGRVYLHGQEVD
jgi:hypothetical protein